MKYFLLSLVLTVLLSTSLLAQQKIINEKHQRVLTHVENNVFEVEFLDSDGAVVQEGQYWKEGELYKPHGTWKLYSSASGDLVTTSTFDKGERLSVETVVNGEVVKADKQQLSIKKIEQQIDLLEKRIADLKEN